MKAITLHQPWASLVAEGTKTVETRSRPAPRHLIGQRIAIHAGKKRVRITREYDPAMHHAMTEAHGPDWQDGLPLGAVVATARLTGCFRVTGWKGDREPRLAGYGERTPDVRTDAYGDFRPGRWLWTLEEVEKLDPPVPARGFQSLWEWEPEGER